MATGLARTKDRQMSPLDIFRYSGAFQRNNRDKVPDIIEFVTGKEWLDRGDILYPRQATLLKVMFLEIDNLTEYDLKVIDEWSKGFVLPKDPVRSLDPNQEPVMKYVGDWGCQPDVLERMQWLIDHGYRWFKHVLAVLGRRSGKGYVGALAGAYVLWNYIQAGDTRQFYGIDRDKRLACQVFAGKKMQARDNQWRDLVNVINGAPCFREYVNTSLGESLTVFSNTDLRNMGAALLRETTMDMATFEIVPKEATVMAARGPASFMQYYDEMAHMVATSGSSRSAADVYDSAEPSLDQFDEDAFIYCGSSPWEMIGKFYELVQQGLEVSAETHEAVYPSTLILQLESWAIYVDWQLTAQETPMLARPGYWWTPRDESDQPLDPDAPMQWREPIYFKPLKGAIQEYDDDMRKKERANPDTFRVERRCLDPDIRVLKADLTWARIDDLQQGDQVVALDEQSPGDGTQRRMRTAKVVQKWDNEDEAYRITFTDGSSVVCSGTHRWFSTTEKDSSCGSFRWRSIYRPEGGAGPRQSIKVGDKIAHLVDPWEEDHSWEAGYLAGVYDGEGTAIGYPRREFRVSFVQNPNEVLDATLDYLRDKGFHPRYMPKNKDPEGIRWPAQTWVIQGLPEVLRFVGQIGGHKIHRQAIPNMWEDRGLGRVNGKTGYKVIASIESVGRRRLVDIETTTGTFFAEGLISHNSKWATAMDAYFNSAHVARMFDAWPDPNGEKLDQQERGSPLVSYVVHGDPGKTGSNFGFCIGHKISVPGSEMPHVIIDVVKAWTPQDFPNAFTDPENIIDNEMDYTAIEAEMKWYIDQFLPIDFSLDQWNSIGILQRLQAHARKNFKVAQVWERTATAPINWNTAETMKTALSLNLVHAPYHELFDLEMLFLRKVPGANKVDHPIAGPVTTKDVYDAVSIVVFKLIGGDVAAFLGEQLSNLGLVTGMPGPNSPAGQQANMVQQSQAGMNDIQRQFEQFRQASTRSRRPR